MKRLFPKIIIVCALVLLATIFVACNKRTNPSTPASDDPVPYEPATYTVTYVSNGLVDFSNFNLSGVEAGTYISAPTNSDGSVAIPLRTGYTFSYWSSDGSTAYDFAGTPVNSDLTLTAVYLPNTYTHTVDITAKLVQSEENGKTVYRIESGVYASGAMPQDPSLVSTYNSSVGAFSIPTTVDATDRFLYWYYMNDDGEPVQFSTQAAASADGVQTVTQLVNYKFTKSLTLYAMWYSLQPKITVKFNDSLSDTVYGQKDYQQTDYVLDTDAPDMQEAKEGYVFEKWYYLKTVGGEETKVDFGFDTLATGSNPTNIADASGIESVFENGTLNLYASWKPLVSIASIADFETKLYNVMHGDNSSEDDKKALQNAVVKFAGTLDFGTTEYKPLFDESHKFEGDIDGGVYNDQGELTGKAKIVGGLFGDATSASVFGNIGGTLKNLDFENVGLKFAAVETDGVAFSAGAIATYSSAKIENCNVTFDSVSINIDGATVEHGYLEGGLANVVFGGMVARNVGGEIKNSTITVAASVLSESIEFGGVVGKNESAGKIEGVTVNVNVSSIKCVDNNKAADGLSFAKVGGIASTNGGLITKSTVVLTVSSLESKNGLDLGGVAASSTGGLVLNKAELSLGTSAAPAVVGANVNVGGLTGKSEGYVQSSVASVAVYLNDTAIGLVAAGGLVGNNYSIKSDYNTGDTSMGTIVQSYATGTLNIASDVSATVYAGGLAGRNNKSNISNDFAIVSIAVENGGTSNLGKLFGSMESSATVKSSATVMYANETTLSLNGEAAEGLVVGTATEQANFESAEFVIGASSTVKFDSTIWQITSGLPEHKPFE